MQTDRRAILTLVALGRVTPAEAERLLIAWNEGREGLWIFTVCFALALLNSFNPHLGLAALMQNARALLWEGSLHRIVSVLTNLLGGVL
jgi:hypothetical protein